MQTNLSQSIDITENKAKYDESVKELFADKQVLACRRATLFLEFFGRVVII